MQSNQTPVKISTPFASNAGTAFKRSIPADSSSTIPGQANFEDGFPPETFLKIDNGGIPVSGKDMNGILNHITNWLRFFIAGEVVAYDANFQTAIGGYPLGARVQSGGDSSVIWRSTVEANSTNPDAGGGGWVCDLNLKANLNSPNFTGVPTVPSPGSGDDSSQIPNTDWVRARAIEYANGAAAGVRFPFNMAVYASIGSFVFTVPGGVSKLEAIAVGGGSGGAGCDGNQAGAGGGGGGVAVRAISVSPGQQILVVVGAGGTSGYNQNGTVVNAGAGGTSSFGVYISASGGVATGILAGAAGGQAYGGDLNIPGECGTDSSPGSALYGGKGGNSGLGFGSGGRASTNDSNDNQGILINGQGYGGGGGGGYLTSAAGYGGAGSSGVVIIRY